MKSAKACLNRKPPKGNPAATAKNAKRLKESAKRRKRGAGRKMTDDVEMRISAALKKSGRQSFDEKRKGDKKRSGEPKKSGGSRVSSGDNSRRKS